MIMLTFFFFLGPGTFIKPPGFMKLALKRKADTPKSKEAKKGRCLEEPPLNTPKRQSKRLGSKANQAAATAVPNESVNISNK